MNTLEVIARIAPQRQKMNYVDYLEIAGESKIVEWVEGEVISYMPPTVIHQDISGFLFYLLESFVQFFRLGKVQQAPFEVKLWPDGPAREPDVLFIATENMPNLSEKRFSGAPDLIIEIISPSSASEDRVRKFDEYQRAGVREYWLVDPRPYQQQADFYLLGKDGLYHPAPLTEEGHYHSVVIPNFWLDLAWLWTEPLPNPQLRFAEIMVSIEELPDEVKDTYKALAKILSAHT
jgi:Uma2 family endonuclease